MQNDSSPRRFLRRAQVEDRVALRRSAIYDKMNKGGFPKPVRLSAGCVRWLEADIDRWIQERVESAS